MAGWAVWMGAWLWPGLCSLAAAAPFTWAAKRVNLPVRSLLALAVFFLAGLALARLELWFQVLPSPWQGMTLQALLALAVILVGGQARRDGLTLDISGRAWRDACMATALLIGFLVARAAALRWTGLGGSGEQPGMAFLLYQATLPGIAEELVYRGVIQSRLNQVFGTPWTLFSARLGWGFVISAVLFWAIHAFRYDPGQGLSFTWQTLTMQMIAGLAFGWLRERTGSIVPGVVAHNLTNVVWTLA